MIRLKKIFFYLLPVIASLVFLVYLLFATARTASASKQSINWDKYDLKFKRKNIKRFDVNVEPINNMYRMKRADFNAFYFQDPGEQESGIKKYLYSRQNNPSPNTRLITILSSTGDITGVLFSKSGAYLDEFELASKGEDDKTIWHSYSEFVNDSTYKNTKVIYMKTQINGALSLVDSVTRIHSLSTQQD